MSDRTGIQWTDATWNPVRGCSRVSEGCRNCYAERVAARFSTNSKEAEIRSGRGLRGGGGRAAFEGFAEMTATGPRWTGRVELVPHLLDQPLRWKRPRKIFVNSMSDLFHEKLSDEAIESVFRIMALANRHTFQVLTKRPHRMREFLLNRHVGQYWQNPLSHIWLGVSVEDQATADERIPLLLQTPAAVRFISAEPLLGPVDLTGFPGLDWVIVGGESGPGARPMHPDWARSLREQCAVGAEGIPFFFKQWGEHAVSRELEHLVEMDRVGKKVAGRKLDGREWNEFPKGA